MRAVAQANLSAPLDDSRTNQLAWFCGCRATAKLAKANTDGEVTARCNRPIHRGSGDGTHGQICRVNWGPSHLPPIWVGGLVSELISCRVEARGADEVVVSVDPAGQHNPLASQGPLDGIVSENSCFSFPLRGSLVRKDHRRKINETLAAYKSLGPDNVAAKVTAEFPFEAVPGKTRRTEF